MLVLLISQLEGSELNLHTQQKVRCVCMHQCVNIPLQVGDEEADDFDLFVPE